MNKTKIMVFLLLAAVLILGIVSAKEVWTFNNFVNKYQVYGSAICNVQGTKTCPSELGWQGRSISFKFKLNQSLAETANFSFVVKWFIDERPIDIYVNNKKIADNFIVTQGGNIPVCYPVNESTGISECIVPGAYSFEFASSLLKNHKQNKIKIAMRHIKVGYGRPSQGFVLGEASLADSS